MKKFWMSGRISPEWSDHQVSIYQHYREEERLFVDQVLRWQDEVKTYYKERLSDFLDPRQQEIVQTIIGQDDEMNVSYLGGSQYAERRRVRLAPPYLETIEDDFQLTLFTIDYPDKFVTLEHRDVLGSLMNLGLKREKFGDIFLGNGIAQVITATEIADYVKWNVDKIGKASVQLQEVPLSEHIKPKEIWVESTVTASSMRLDVVLAQVYKLSRSSVLPYIGKGFVKINWKLIDQPSFILAEGDYISVRGFGRAQISEIVGMTKKDKIRLRYRRLS